MRVSSFLKNPIHRRTIGGAAIGSGLGGASSYFTDKSNKKMSKGRKRVNILAGMAGGGVLGGSFGRISGMKPRPSSYSGSYGRGGSTFARPTNPKKYFSTLGLSGKEKTKADIGRSFKNLAKKHHPDRHGGSHETMQNINDAYRDLKQTSWFQKLAYDNFWIGFEKQSQGDYNV